MSRPKRILMWVMSFLYASIGFSHLVNPDQFVAIMPPKLPMPEVLNVISGLIEITLGVFLLEPKTRIYAAWGIIALLIAVFPANLHVATQNIGLPSGEPGTGNAVVNWVRLPFQAVFMLWAWWYTRPDVENGAVGA
jgi:uncharacterized membrane protein